jgi:hypothetical protein
VMQPGSVQSVDGTRTADEPVSKTKVLELSQRANQEIVVIDIQFLRWSSNRRWAIPLDG